MKTKANNLQGAIKIEDYNPEKNMFVKNIESIFVRANKRFERVLCKDIIHVQADGDYCTLFLRNKETIRVHSTLRKIHEQLPIQFFRCHRSYLVNLNEIRYIYQTILNTTTDFTVSIGEELRRELLKQLNIVKDKSVPDEF